MDIFVAKFTCGFVGKIHIPQNIKIAVVGKRNVIHLDLALDVFQSRGIFLVLQGGLRTHNAHETI